MKFIHWKTAEIAVSKAGGKDGQENRSPESGVAQMKKPRILKTRNQTPKLPDEVILIF